MRNEGKRRLRVLAADDSAVMREVMRAIFATHEERGDDAMLPRMELCGVARDGMEAVELAVGLLPDVLVLDLEMPRLNGLGVLEQLRTVLPRLPVILCSTYTEHGARATLDALALGARDYVTKPEHQKNYAVAVELLAKQLLPKIAALGLGGHESGARRIRWDGEGESRGSEQRAKAVVIGVSTGGPSALETMLGALPAGFSVPVLIAQHMPRLFTGALAKRLNRMCRMPVEEARDGVVVEAGKIWLAPGDCHMEVASTMANSPGTEIKVLRLRKEGPVDGCMPSVNVLFRSAAKAYGAGTLAVVMTGMGSDGLEGARLVRAAGGGVLAQDEASSAVWGMPARVVDAGLATAVLPLKSLAGAVMERVARVGTVMEGRREAMYGVL